MDLFDLARRGALSDAELEAAFDALVSTGARASGVFDAEGRTPLMVAAAHANTRLMRLLLDQGAPVDERSPADGATALHCCVSDDSEVEDPSAAVALLLDAGADIEAADGGELTPLSYSVANHRVASTRLLLDRGADVNRRVNFGYTILILATEEIWLARRIGRAADRHGRSVFVFFLLFLPPLETFPDACRSGFYVTRRRFHDNTTL